MKSEINVLVGILTSERVHLSMTLVSCTEFDKLTENTNTKKCVRP